MTATASELREKKCKPCEGGVPKIEREEAQQYLQATPQWSLADDGNKITRKVKCKHFLDGMKLLQAIAEVAEEDQHHPDLHLTGYQNVKIELMTHAIGGLSENDFILAAKIDQIVDDHSG